MTEQKNAPTVLIAEDEVFLRMAVEDVVAECGFGFKSVATGDLALAELQKGDGEIIALLTDIRMPGAASGWEVANVAREVFPAITVVYMTGDNGYKWSTHGVRGSYLLQKPFPTSELAKILIGLQ